MKVRDLRDILHRFPDDHSIGIKVGESVFPIECVLEETQHWDHKLNAQQIYIVGKDPLHKETLSNTNSSNKDSTWC